MSPTFAQRLRALVEWSTYQDGCPVSINCDAALALVEVLEAAHMAPADLPMTRDELAWWLERLRDALARLNKEET